MFEEAKKAVSGFVKAGVNAAMAGINGLFGESKEVPNRDDQEAGSAASQVSEMPAGQEREEEPDPSSRGEATSGQEAFAGKATDRGADSPFWRSGTFNRCDQIGFYNYTTDPTVIGFYLDPENRWIKLHDSLFVPTPEMVALEEKYYRRVEEAAAETAEQRYAKKSSYLVESEEIKEYCDRISFEALTQAHETYLSAAAAGATARKSPAGRKPLPFKLALGVLIVESIAGSSDRGTGRLMSENPFIQYFCGYSSFSRDNYVSHSKISELKKVFDADLMKELNEAFLKMKLGHIHLEAKQKAEEEAEKAKKDLERAEKAAQEAQDAEKEVKSRSAGMATEEVKEAERKAEAANENVKKAEDKAKKARAKVKEFEPKEEKEGGDGEQKEREGEAASSTDSGPANAGSISIDTTCNPGNAKFPMDFDLLNDARKNADKVLSRICALTGTDKPRTNKKVLQNEVKNLSKKKKRTADDIGKVIRHTLKGIEDIFRYTDKVCKGTGYELTIEDASDLMVAKTIYGQQKYMFENHTNQVPHRIVSFSMPHLRPIPRGKVQKKYEFGPKTEISINENGFVRLESFSFDTFNEGTRLKDAIERYREHAGHYPSVVRCDQIYRTRENLEYCNERGIRLSGPKLGRKPKNEEKLKEQMEVEKADMIDRIEIERQISHEKHCWGVGRVMERTPERMEHAVGMAVFLDNLVPSGF